MKNSNTGLFILTGLLVCLFFVLYYAFETKETVVKTQHTYDYLIEVNGDSIITYDIYDDKHVLVADSILATQLDSVIIKDNE